MPKREVHRQGVVYGPQRSYGRRDLGSIFGSLLGLTVVVGTVGLLGFGVIYLLQQGDSPSTTPPASAPAVVATASAVPSGSLGAVGTPSTSASPLASALPSASAPTTPTPAPTIFVPDVLEGPGYVTFGTSASPDLEVNDPRTTFTNDEEMVWSAFLPEPQDSVDLQIRVLKLDPAAPDGQRLLRTDKVKPKVKGADRFLRHVRIKRALDGPGLYTVQYVRDNTVLAIGSFLVVEEAPASPEPSAT